MRIAAVGRALPDHDCDQKQLLGALERVWGHRFHNAERLQQLHRNVQVDGRHLALPIDEYEKLDTFTAANDAFVRCALPLGARALSDGLAQAGLAPQALDHLFFVSVTGIPVFVRNSDLVYAKLRWDFRDDAYLNYRFEFGEDDEPGATVEHTIHRVTLGYQPISRVRLKAEYARHLYDRGPLHDHDYWGLSAGVYF